MRGWYSIDLMVGGKHGRDLSEVIIESMVGWEGRNVQHER